MAIDSASLEAQIECQAEIGYKKHFPDNIQKMNKNVLHPNRRTLDEVKKPESIEKKGTLGMSSPDPST